MDPSGTDQVNSSAHHDSTGSLGRENLERVAANASVTSHTVEQDKTVTSAPSMKEDLASAESQLIAMTESLDKKQPVASDIEMGPNESLKQSISKMIRQERASTCIQTACCGCFGLVLQLVLCGSIGSFLFGFNIALLNTCINTISSEYGWCEKKGDLECTNAVLLMAFLRTSVFVGAAFGSMFGGRFVFIGRRMLYLVTMSLFVVGVISSVVANSFPALLWARTIVGCGVGVVSVVVPIYMSEMTPAQYRGAYGVFHQLFVTIGIFVAVVLGLPFETFPTEEAAKESFTLRMFDKVWWRVMLGSGMIPVIIAIYFLLKVFDFETPHYYVETGQTSQAEHLLKKIYAKENVTEELKGIQEARKEALYANKIGFTFWKAASIPVYRHVIFVGCVLSALQQLSGINVFVASSNKLFSDADLEPHLVTIMSTVLTFLNVLMTFPSIYLIEKLGRRTLLFIGTLGMALSVLPGTILLSADPKTTSTSWIAIAGALGFIIFFSVSFGPILWVYLFEIYPIEIKGVASGLATACNWIAGIGMVFASSFIDVKINYIIFCVMSFVAAGFIFCFVLETKGRSLENSPFMVDKEGNPISHLHHNSEVPAVGRGLTFILLGCLMMEHHVFQFFTGVALVVSGIIYFFSTRAFGGVPKPLLQRNLEELPLTTELRFVNTVEDNPLEHARQTPQGFRL